MPLFGKTSPEEMLIEIILVVLIAFIPSIIYMIVLRYVEKYEREPWGSMFTVFLWGATMGVVAVIIFRGIFNVHFADFYPDMATDRRLKELVAASIITPFIAEIIKPIGLLFVRHDIEESEDGLIYGAVSGLGYAATENLLYGIFLVSIYGLEFYIYIVIVRSISVVLINASTSAMTGFGVSRATAVKHKTGTIWAFPLFLFGAMIVHGFFNYLMVAGLGIGDLMSVSSGLVFAIGISIIFMTWIYFKIYKLDRLDEIPEEPEEAPAAGPDYDEYPSRRRDVDYPPPHRRPHAGSDYPHDYYDEPVHHRRPHDAYPHHRPPPAHASHSGPARGIDARPPRARPVGHASPHSRPPPPPSIYVEQPRVPEREVTHRDFGRRRRADEVPDTKRRPPRDRGRAPPEAERHPRKEKVFEAEWLEVEEEPGRKPPARGRRRPEPREPELDWEEEPEAAESVEWEEPEPKKPPKGRSRKKPPKKVEWSDDELDFDETPHGKKKGKIDEDNWWFEDD
jgi:RsiW-degrading membrane proteinase PrsW (M82 family)